MWDKISPKSFKNSKIYGLGLKAYTLKDFKGAVNCFKRVIEREPDISSGWYMLLESLSYLRKWEEMIEIGEEALKNHPNFGPNYSWLGDAYNQQGKRKQAMDCYKKALNLLEKELILLEKKLVKYPKDADEVLLNSLGEINIRLGNYEEAIKYSKRAASISPNEHNFHSIGLAYKELRDYDNAIDFYEKSLDVNPKHSYAWFDLGLIYEDLNESNKAIECYEKAVESSPQWVKLREKLSEVKPDSLALLKKAPDIRSLFDEEIAQQQTKSEITLSDLNEIETILKDNKLSVEERKYFEQRKLKLTRELELDEMLRKDKLKTLHRKFTMQKEIRKNDKKVEVPAKELQKILKEKGSSLGLRLCEKLIENLEKSLGRDLTIEDIKFAADSYLKQEESSTAKKRKKVKKIDKYQTQLLQLLNKQKEQENLIKSIPILIKEYSLKYNFLKVGVEKVKEKGEEKLKYLKERMLQHINSKVYQNPDDRIKDEQLAYRFYDLKNLEKEMNNYKNKLVGTQNWLERLKEEYFSAELEIKQLKKKIESFR